MMIARPRRSRWFGESAPIGHYIAISPKPFSHTVIIVRDKNVTVTVKVNKCTLSIEIQCCKVLMYANKSVCARL